MRERDFSRLPLAGTLLERFGARLRGSFGAGGWRRSRTLAWLWIALPAFFAAFELSILVRFLNPELPYGFVELARGTAGLGLLLLPFSALAHRLATRWRNVRGARLLPWSVTFVLAAAALGDWIHASYFSFYLPPATGASLIKCALWLSLGTILCFYTALLHTASHRRYGPRSVLLLALVAAGVLYASYDRRASVRAVTRPAAAEETLLTMRAPALLVVEVDGATLDVLLPLARQARLPFFSALVDGGVNARLATVAPLQTAAARATLATGKLPYRHLVLGKKVYRSAWISGAEFRLLPIGFTRSGIGALLSSSRAVATADRQALTLPEILARAGLRTAVIGAPRALLGKAELFAAASEERFVDGPRGATATPDWFEEEIVRGRDTGSGAAPDSLAPYSGTIRAALVEALEQDRRRVAAARSLLARGDAPQTLFLRLGGFYDVAMETRAGFERAELEGDRAAEARLASEALTLYCAHLDSDLAGLWERLPAPRALVVVSAFGVDPPRGVRRVVLEVQRRGRMGGTLASEPDGALWMRGEESVRRGASLPPARVVDVAPTLLYLAGMPISRDLDGRVLTEAIEPTLLQRQPLSFLPSHEPDGRPR
ncbi:MAG: alkaline phosphatase family protein [Thermoanaerobaculia bacterium]